MEARDQKRMAALLEQIAETARGASLTGVLHGAGGAARAHYHRIRDLVAKEDPAAEALFGPLAEDASLDDVGFAAGQLAKWLREGVADAGEPEAQQVFAGDVAISVGDIKLQDLSNLGELIRQNLPAWLRGEQEVCCAEAPATEAPPADPAQAVEEVTVQAELTLNDLESRLAELGEQLSALGLRMGRENLAAAEMQEIAQTMRKLGEEQARLAREHAHARQRLAEGPS